MNKKRSVTFLAVGICNTLLDFLFYTALVFIIFSPGEHTLLVGILSGVFALSSAYITHRFITWRDQNTSKKTILKFFIVTGLGLWLIRPTLLVLFTNLTPLYQLIHTLTAPLGLSLDFITATGAFGLSAALVVVYNFFVYDRLVFTDGRRTERGTGSKS